MQALVKQLSTQLVDICLPKPVVDEYNKRKSNGFGSRNLDFSECQTMLTLLLSMYPQTTIVVDALDEVDRASRQSFLEALNTIANTSKNLVKIFVSSRDDDDIVLKLKDVPNLYISTKDNMRDIERFVLREIDSSISKCKLLRGEVDDQLKTQIITALLEKANGM